MIEPTELDRQIERLLALAREHYGVSARSLDAAMRKIGRRVSRRVHRQAQVICDAQRFAAHPRLRARIEVDRVKSALREVRLAFEAEDRADRRKGAVLSTLGTLSFNLIAVVVLVAVVLRWQGIY